MPGGKITNSISGKKKKRPAVPSEAKSYTANTLLSMVLLILWYSTGCVTNCAAVRYPAPRREREREYVREPARWQALVSSSGQLRHRESPVPEPRTAATYAARSNMLS